MNLQSSSGLSESVRRSVSGASVLALLCTMACGGNNHHAHCRSTTGGVDTTGSNQDSDRANAYGSTLGVWWLSEGNGSMRKLTYLYEGKIFISDHLWLLKDCGWISISDSIGDVRNVFPLANLDSLCDQGYEIEKLANVFPPMAGYRMRVTAHKGQYRSAALWECRHEILEHADYSDASSISIPTRVWRFTLESAVVDFSGSTDDSSQLIWPYSVP
jgi:hypothetical protein